MRHSESHSAVESPDLVIANREAIRTPKPQIYTNFNSADPGQPFPEPAAADQSMA